MKATSQFEITRRKASVNASLVFDAAAPRGFALGAHATDATKFAVAQHNTFVGHLTRIVRVGGLTLVDRTFGVTSDVPVGVESPFTAGQEVSVEKAEEIEVEGGDYLVLAGDGALTAETAVGANLSFKDGKLRATQAG